MIEPTEAQVETFKRAWESEEQRQIKRASGAVGGNFDRPVRLGDRTRAGLRAVLNLEADHAGE